MEGDRSLSIRKLFDRQLRATVGPQGGDDQLPNGTIEQPTAGSGSFGPVPVSHYGCSFSDRAEPCCSTRDCSRFVTREASHSSTPCSPRCEIEKSNRRDGCASPDF